MMSVITLFTLWLCDIVFHQTSLTCCNGSVMRETEGNRKDKELEERPCADLLNESVRSYRSVYLDSSVSSRLL